MESKMTGRVYYSVILFVGSMNIATPWTQETSTGGGMSSLGLNSTHNVINSTTATINPTANQFKNNTTAVINSTSGIVPDETATINSSIITVTNSTPVSIENTSQSNSSSPTSHGSTQPINGSDIVVCQVYDRNSLLQSLQNNCTLVNITYGGCYCLIAEYCCFSLSNCCPDNCTCVERSTPLDRDLIITISVSGFLLLLMCTFVIAYFVRHATSKKYQKQLKPTISASSNSSGVAAALTTASVAVAPTTATLTAGRARADVRGATTATTVTPSARMNSHWGHAWRDYSPPNNLTRNQPYRPLQQRHML